MLVNKLDSVCIWSENYQDLAKWYQEVFELEVDMELNLPDDTGINFKIKDFLLWIGYHDQVKGKNKDPYRIMVGFDVDSVTDTYEKMIAKGVEFISEPHISPTKDYYVTTAKDPEGNILQFFSDQK